MTGETNTGVMIAFFTFSVIMLVVFPLFVAPFVDTSPEYAVGDFAQSLIDIFDAEITFIGFSFNIFPSFIRTPIIALIEAWSYVPTTLATIILVPLLIGLFYSLISIIKDMIPFT